MCSGACHLLNKQSLQRHVLALYFVVSCLKVAQLVISWVARPVAYVIARLHCDTWHRFIGCFIIAPSTAFQPKWVRSLGSLTVASSARRAWSIATRNFQRTQLSVVGGACDDSTGTSRRWVPPQWGWRRLSRVSATCRPVPLARWWCHLWIRFRRHQARNQPALLFPHTPCWWQRNCSASMFCLVFHREKCVKNLTWSRLIDENDPYRCYYEWRLLQVASFAATIAARYFQVQALVLKKH